jgi:tetratricopeptide (TPR) repeat protein
MRVEHPQPSAVKQLIPIMKLRVMLLCGALSAATLPAADTLTGEFQRALFEEEANRNLPAAIAGYEAVIKRLDEQRQLAATAVFRLGESYRKLGKTNEAVAAYERIIKEFADQETLVKLSGQNLSVLRPAGSSPFDSHVVQPGDTLSRIARQHNVTTRNLEEWNPGLDSRMMRVGSRIRVRSWVSESPFNANSSAPGSTSAADLAELRRLEILLETVRSLEPMSEEELRTLSEFAGDDEVAGYMKVLGRARRGFESTNGLLRERSGDDRLQRHAKQMESEIESSELFLRQWRDTALRMLEARVEAARRLAGREWAEGQSSSASQLDPATRARQKELLEQEIALVEGQLKEVRKQVEVGAVPTSEPIAKQRELIHLQRQVAGFDSSPDSIRRQRQRIDQELGLVRQLVEETKRRIENGKGSRNDLVEFERQMLQLMREDLDLAARPAPNAAHQSQ